MNVMETKEINNVSEIIQGCNEAMINYALTEDMRLVRMVLFIIQTRAILNTYVAL